jgi:hypothetical protein
MDKMLVRVFGLRAEAKKSEGDVIGGRFASCRKLDGNSGQLNSKP